MAVIEQRLAAMGLELPEPLKVREGLRMPFTWVRVRGNRAYISGHLACNPDGTLAKPLGKLGPMSALKRATLQPASSRSLFAERAFSPLLSRGGCDDFDWSQKARLDRTSHAGRWI